MILTGRTGLLALIGVLPIAVSPWPARAFVVLLVLLVTFDVKHREGRLDQDELAMMAANQTPELLSDEGRQPTNRDEVLILMAEEKPGKH